MSDTEQLFTLAAVWTVASVFIARLAANWVARIALFAALVGIPFWELPYGYLNFSKLCAEQAKLLVFEKIQPQQIICADYPYVTLHTKLLEKGFASVEVREKAGDVRRYEKSSAGGIAESAQSKIASEYCLTFANNNHLPWNVVRHDVLILHSNDGKVAGRQSRFDWMGMWWQKQASPILGRGGSCASDTDLPILALRNGTG